MLNVILIIFVTEYEKTELIGGYVIKFGYT